MASQVLGSGFSLPANTQTLVSDEVVAKVVSCRSGGSDATFPGLQITNREGNTRVVAGGVFGGATNMSDYLRVATWSPNIAYNQGSWVFYQPPAPAAASYWIRTAATASVVGVPPSAPDWTQQTTGFPNAIGVFTEMGTQLGATGNTTSFQGDGKLAAPGCGTSTLVLSDYEALQGGVATTLGASTFHSKLTISAPTGPIAGSAPPTGVDATLSFGASSVAGVPALYEIYNGAGNPGGGAPANCLSLFGYANPGGLAAYFITTPCAGATFPSATAPAILQLTAPQQTGRVNIANAASASAAIPMTGLTTGAVVIANVLGEASAVGSTTQVSPAAFDATLTSVIADVSVAGQITLRGNGVAAAANGVVVEWFIVRL